MQKEKPPVREQGQKDNFTLRIPEHVNRLIKETAKDIGVSQNDLILLMVDLGIKVYQGFIPEQREELLRFLSQKQK